MRFDFAALVVAADVEVAAAVVSDVAPAFARGSTKPHAVADAAVAVSTVALVVAHLIVPSFASAASFVVVYGAPSAVVAASAVAVAASLAVSVVASFATFPPLASFFSSS